MKKTLKFLALAALSLSFVACGNSNKLGTFKADLGKKAKLGQTIRLPYTSIKSYYGYVKPGSEPDEKKNGKNFFYVYVWVPVVAPEIGVRMISPVPNGMAPAEGDFKGKIWDQGVADTANYFDTYIEFDRAASIINPGDIKAKIKTTEWWQYGYNDDSSEMPKNPGGRPYNSLMRLTSEVSNPMKALVRGLYRIGFTTYKHGDVKGTFLAQVGAPIDLPGVVIASDIDELIEKVNAGN